MKVLVTGGTGVVGESAVRALHRAGHGVRVLSRHAGRDERWWPEGVDGWAGDVSNERSIHGAAAGCDAIVHIAGIADERPPAITFQSVNIDGTRYLMLEAERAEVRKVVYVSSLGAERGKSPYHKSKCVAEDVVRTFTRDWVVVRPGAVYGPGDEHLSVLLRMVRTLPVIPTIGDGNQKFQPIWHEDLADALVRIVERDAVRCAVLEVAGTDVTSQNDLVRRLCSITGRSIAQAPLPEMVAQWGLRALGALGVDVPFTENQLEMLAEGNVIAPGNTNALTDLLGIAPTPLDAGLRRLADEQRPQLPSEGVGPSTRKRFWVDITGSRYDADALFERLRTGLPHLMPDLVKLKAEPGASMRIEEGDTLTLEIPLRGQIQVRVGEVMDRRITLLTVAGHPIAGAVRFLVEERERDVVRFEIQVYDRPSSTIDRLLMRTAGEWLQRQAWIALARNVANDAGGTASEVQMLEDDLDAHDLAVVDDWARELNAQLSRNETSGGRL
jgi:nucleoside-diphosphate-sugar epimerase